MSVAWPSATVSERSPKMSTLSALTFSLAFRFGRAKRRRCASPRATLSSCVIGGPGYSLRQSRGANAASNQQSSHPRLHLRL
jgi:hypothetical protein